MGVLAEKGRGHQHVSARCARPPIRKQAQRLHRRRAAAGGGVGPGAGGAGVDTAAADATARAAGPRAPEQGRLARRARRVPAGVPLDVSGGDPFMFMQDAGPALRVSNAHRHRDAVHAAAMTFGRMTGGHPWLVGIVDGAARHRARRHDDGAREANASATDLSACASHSLSCPARSSRKAPDEPRPAAGGRTRRPQETNRLGVLCVRVHLHRPRRQRLRATHASPRTATGCTSKPATTTKSSTPARCGSATTSAAARNGDVRSHADDRRRVRRHRRRRAGLQRLARLEEARALQRRRVRLRRRRFLGQLLLQLVGADVCARRVRSGSDSSRSGRGSTRPIARFSAACSSGFSFKQLDVTGYVFNPDDEKPTFVLAIAVTF